MSTVVALRRQERPVVATRSWGGNRLAEASRLAAPSLRHRSRSITDPGPGTDAVPTATERHTFAMVARLWLGVLSIFALIVFCGLVLIILGAWALGYRPVVVTSGSMSPVVRTGDIVITKPIGAHDRIGTQTVIDFDDPVTAERHLHRVIEVTDAGYRTKGDANPTPDPQLVPHRSIHGAGFVLAPYVGYLPMWVDEHRWQPLLASAVVIALLATMSRRRWMWAEHAR